MLKLEREKRSEEVAIRIKAKDRLFNSSFIAAFLAASLFHLFSFFLISIKTPLREQDLKKVKPALVFADTSFKESSRHLNLAKKSGYLLLEMPARNELPSLILTPQESDAKPLALEENRRMFALLEREEEILRESSFEFTPIRVKVGGPLALKPLSFKAPGKRRVEGKILRHLALYEVEVENRTGSIFWVSLKTEIENQKLQREADRILKSLSFQPDESGFVSKGIIEIILESESA